MWLTASSNDIQQSVNHPVLRIFQSLILFFEFLVFFLPKSTMKAVHTKYAPPIRRPHHTSNSCSRRVSSSLMSWTAFKAEACLVNSCSLVFKVPCSSFRTCNFSTLQQKCCHPQKASQDGTTISKVP